jgi:Mn2+/Fe2+ NRAMP family transporter
MTVWQRLKPLRIRLLTLLVILGPGLITASADNDAPGIATYSMAGSTYGYRFLWVILAITVGEVIVMEMAGRMGAVTGKGAADLSASSSASASPPLLSIQIGVKCCARPSRPRYREEPITCSRCWPS